MSRFVSLSVFVFCVFTSMSLAAQDEQPDQKEMRERLAGTWTLDLVKSKKYLDAATFARIPSDIPEVSMVFGEDNSLIMKRGERKLEVTYYLTAVEGSDSEFKCQMEVNGQKAESAITFLEEDTIKIGSAAEPPVVLTRPAKEYSLDEAKTILVGSWETDAEATKARTDEWGDGVRDFRLTLNKDGSFEAAQAGEPDVGTYTLKLAESEETDVDQPRRFELLTKIDDDEQSMSVEVINQDRVLMHLSEKLFVILGREKQ